MVQENKPPRKKFRLIPALLILAIPWLVVAGFLHYQNQKAADFVHKPNKPEQLAPSADHSEFAILQQDFESPQEVTKACISCHTERHKEVMQQAHWKWERTETVKNRGKITWGKKNIINNFCISIVSNEPRCNSCHAGYGWKDGNFDFSKSQNVDCMVCHDNSGEYEKAKKLAGYPPKGKDAPDLTKVAQSAGQPKKENCGSCHFVGGGGNNVKHGDLERGLLKCPRDVDVHMAKDGANMECVACHEATKHQMTGKLYTVSSVDTNRATCTECHTESPHVDKSLNLHTAKVACQTCHIPEFAKMTPTKMEWDWSKAGKFTEDGKILKKKDENGFTVYNTKKGAFDVQKNVKPEYIWFNGTANHTLVTDKFPDTSEAIVLNPLYGSYTDGKIIPMKVHIGHQPYDPVNQNLLIPDLFGGKDAYWKKYDWQKAIQSGMDSAGVAFSGEYEFVTTKMLMPVNHMVAPKEQSLTCKDCHSSNSRLAGLDGFYMPGRNRNAAIDWIGIVLVLIALGGSLTHGLLRIFSTRKS